MYKENFFKAKRFGDELEKNIAKEFLIKMYPDHDIKDLPKLMHSKGLSPKMGRDKKGLAIPDHAVVSRKTKKIVALYDSKNKNTLYSAKGHKEKFWSTDEKLHDYRAYGKKYKVPCCEIFYNKEYDPDHVYTVNVDIEPKFYELIKNKYGDHWYGYYLSQTTPYSIAKHNKNIREQDMKKTWKATTIEEKKTLLFAILDRCKPEQSYRPMDPKKITYFKNKIKIAKTLKELDQIIWNLYCSGKGMGLNSKNYNDIIKYA
jgi:hypothetical protein|tara:strand:+ start:283 stop:1059 length:777 start_codon:yes stop_codon:yes gene_type:complete